VQGDLLRDDREAEAGTGRAGGRPAGEWLEQTLALGGGDARAVVLDTEAQ
jgi:hypothetical protein